MHEDNRESISERRNIWVNSKFVSSDGYSRWAAAFSENQVPTLFCPCAAYIFVFCLTFDLIKLIEG